jgi:hypothetical protein
MRCFVRSLVCGEAASKIFLELGLKAGELNPERAIARY